MPRRVSMSSEQVSTYSGVSSI